MNVLVTGAAGFIGARLLRILVSEGCRVSALVRPNTSRELSRDLESRIQIVEGDIQSNETGRTVESLRPEICVHLAWITTPGVYLSSPENLNLVTGSVKLATVLASSGCRKMVAAGTCFEYDTSLGVLSENSPVAPRTLYAASKLALYTMLNKYTSLTKMKFAWPRIFYLYGPGEHDRRLVPTLVRSFLKEEPVKMTAPDKVRDYLHVDDVASAIWAVAKSDHQGPVNIGSGAGVTLGFLSEQIARLTGKPNQAKFNALPDDPADPAAVQADNRLLRSIGWKPKYSLDDGLKNAIDGWRAR